MQDMVLLVSGCIPIQLFSGVFRQLRGQQALLVAVNMSRGTPVVVNSPVTIQQSPCGCQHGPRQHLHSGWQMPCTTQYLHEVCTVDTVICRTALDRLWVRRVTLETACSVKMSKAWKLDQHGSENARFQTQMTQVLPRSKIPSPSPIGHTKTVQRGLLVTVHLAKDLGIHGLHHQMRKVPSKYNWEV